MPAVLQGSRLAFEAGSERWRNRSDLKRELLSRALYQKRVLVSSRPEVTIKRRTQQLAGLVRYADDVEWNAYE